jgi:hypothetical protein
MTNFKQQKRRSMIKTYVVTVVLGVLTSSLFAYAAFSPDTVLTADLLNQEFSKIQPLGVGQSWRNMRDANNPSGQTRAAGQTYVNDTGRPIQVMVVGYGSYCSQLNVSETLNGTPMAIGYGCDSNAPSDGATISAIIPDGNYYSFETNSPSYNWHELR